jgi:hypothetical protein
MTLLTLLQSPTGSGTIGSLSATLGAVTLSSNGTLTAAVTGTLASTLGLLTLSAAGTLSGTPVPEPSRGKGGWDPYVYKRRNKRRDKLEDVRQFMADVLGRDFDDAPTDVIEQVEEAKQAAREVLAVAPVTGLTDTDHARLQRALSEINEFYRVLREQVRLAREADDDEDDELLLLH